MKRITIFLSLIFALAIALSASIPTLAANPADTVITGTLGGHINITAHPGNFSLPELVPDVASNSSAKTVTVKCNKAWALTVSEVDGDGHMSVGTSILTNPLMVQGGVLGTPTSIAGAPKLVTAGTKTGGDGFDIDDIIFSQTATYADDDGTYTITVTFTGSIIP